MLLHLPAHSDGAVTQLVITFGWSVEPPTGRWEGLFSCHTVQDNQKHHGGNDDHPPQIH